VKRSDKLRWAAGCLTAACLATSVFLLQRLDTIRSGATLDDVLYISSPRLVKRLSLGYEGLLADIYWTRAVQYYGGVHHLGGGTFKQLWPLLNITTQLDPHLIPAYEYGAAFLTAPPPNGPGMPQQAVQLMQYGIQNNPDDWHLYYNLGFVYYMDLKDYPKASAVFERGSRTPHAHPFLKVLAAQSAERGGDAQTAGLLWQTTYETTHDKYVRETAVWHLRALKVDSDVTKLEELVGVYRQKYGRLPASMVEMVRAGLLPGVPLDPLGNPYKLAYQGKVVVDDPESLPFIQKGLPEGYSTVTVPRGSPEK
jgi:hypothetical protein